MSSRRLSRIIAMQSLYEWDFWLVNKEQRKVSLFFSQNRDEEKALKEIIKKNKNAYSEKTEDKFIRELTLGTKEKIKEIDNLITKYAPEWPIPQIAAIDRAVLRLAIYELIFTDTPPKVIIDEAVEIAKKFGGINSSKFINGVLGTIYKNEIEEKNANKKGKESKAKK